MHCRLLLVILDRVTISYLTKDAAMYGYYLGKNHGWTCNFAYFNDKGTIHDKEFEEYCSLTYLGDTMVYRSQIRLASAYLLRHAKEYDVLMVYNYGSPAYSLAKAAKSANPHIKVWSKLDMRDDGFSHFYDGTWKRRMKGLLEVWKTRNIDLFTVETKYFFNTLKHLPVFKNKLYYLPNGVSLFKIREKDLADVPKENIIVTVGRLGNRDKDNELFMRALMCLPSYMFENWKIYLVGPAEDEFKNYVGHCLGEKPYLQGRIVFTGAIYDRMELYRMLARAKIICMTSRLESFCIATIEGMRFGAVPVLTNYGKIVEDITDNRKYGSIMSGRTPEELAMLLKNNMQQDIMPINEMKRYIQDNFDYVYWSRNLDEILQRTLKLPEATADYNGTVISNNIKNTGGVTE